MAHYSTVRNAVPAMNLPWFRLVTLLALLVTVPVVIPRMLHLYSLH